MQAPSFDRDTYTNLQNEYLETYGCSVAFRQDSSSGAYTYYAYCDYSSELTFYTEEEWKEYQTWNREIPVVAGATNFGLTGMDYNFTIDYGDGTIQTFEQFPYLEYPQILTTEDGESIFIKGSSPIILSHQYEEKGDYTVTISGNCPYFTFVPTTDSYSLEHWGDVGLVKIPPFQPTLIEVKEIIPNGSSLLSANSAFLIT